MTFYTLLYINPKDDRKFVSENDKAKIVDYIKCCILLNNSLLKFGYELIILTNNPDEIYKYDKNLKIETLAFNLNIPPDIKFYSAHFKIDVFRYLSTRTNDYSILLDNDIVCLNELPESLMEIVSNNIPIYYDMTDAYQNYWGHETVIKDKTLIMQQKSDGFWTGGEFLGGPSVFWKELYDLCIKYWDMYQKNFNQLFHQGDEMLSSCAIEEYRKNKQIINIGDNGTDAKGVINRYWSIDPLNNKPTEDKFNYFLIHLPLDKVFLSKHKFIDKKTFIKEYQKYYKFKNKVIVLFFNRFHTRISNITLKKVYERITQIKK